MRNVACRRSGMQVGGGELREGTCFVNSIIGGRTHQPKSGHINDFERLLSLIHRIKKNTPMTAAIRKAEITLAHHASRESNFSGSGRSVVSLHQLCQVLMCQSTRDKVKTPKQSKVFALALPSISRTAAHRIKFYACIYTYTYCAHVVDTAAARGPVTDPRVRTHRA